MVHGNLFKYGFKGALDNFKNNNSSKSIFLVLLDENQSEIVASSKALKIDTADGTDAAGGDNFKVTYNESSNETVITIHPISYDNTVVLSSEAKKVYYFAIVVGTGTSKQTTAQQEAGSEIGLIVLDKGKEINTLIMGELSNKGVTMEPNGAFFFGTSTITFKEANA